MEWLVIEKFHGLLVLIGFGLVPIPTLVGWAIFFLEARKAEENQSQEIMAFAFFGGLIAIPVVGIAYAHGVIPGLELLVFGVEYSGGE